MTWIDVTPWIEWQTAEEFRDFLRERLMAAGDGATGTLRLDERGELVIDIHWAKEPAA